MSVEEKEAMSKTSESIQLLAVRMARVFVGNAQWHYVAD